MMSNDVMALRVTNLRALSAQWGGPTSLAKKLKYAGPSYVSQLYTGVRPITEKTARKIEQILGLSVGWMDQDHGSSTAAAELDETVLARVIALVKATLDENHITVSSEKQAEIVSWVYTTASKTGAVDENLIRRIVGIIR